MKNYLTEVKFTGPMKKRIKVSELNFSSGVNLLIGPNGSGKSTIIEILTDHEICKVQCEYKLKVNEKLKLFKFDFEKDNPRTSAYLDGGMFQIVSMFHSHGETGSQVLKVFESNKAEKGILFLDEPEQALDLNNMLNFIKMLKTTKCAQIIIATHSPFLIMQDFNILELEKGYKEKIKKELNKLK